MSIERKYSMYRKIAVFMAINLLIEIVSPTVAWALTGGPSSPEFSSFEPVATTNMVSEFSGDLTYNLPVINVPGVNGSGYAMSLSYHSGTTPEEEASWVGYGWTLNPGAINRGKKGFPDDWKNEDVKYWNKTPANQTVAVGGSIGGLQVFSFNAPISANSSIRYNNYKGFGYSVGAGLSLAKGVVSLGFNVSDGTGSFSLKLNPAAALREKQDTGEDNDKETTAKEKRIAERKEGIINKLDKKDPNRDKSGDDDINVKNRGVLAGLGSGYGLHNFASASRPTQIVAYDGISTTVSLNSVPTPFSLPVGVNVGAFGSYSKQENVPNTIINTYGYMYSANAGQGDMMDYFVDKGSVYTKQDQFLGIPFNNADNYALTGEGLGGGFKLNHGQIGRFHPNKVKSETFIYNVAPDVNIGANFGAGSDIGVGYQTLEVKEWETLSQNGFDTLRDEAVFFRFTNDKGGELAYDGGDITAKRANINFTGHIPGAKKATANESGITKTVKTDSEYNRSLRSSYIGYNTNADMATTYSGVNYKAFTKNTSNHFRFGTVDRSSTSQIGEFSIVNEDGNRYTYGLPVLSQDEKNLQVDLKGVPASNIENKFLVYRDITGSTETKVGEERETPYATSYLITEITSPDYIDRKNDGPTDDDFGGYTKFSYRKAYGAGIDDVSPGGGDDWYKWRMPYAGLSYNRNELSNPKDDLGSVAEGYKEIYYLDTVQTKTHYAVFHTSSREDGFDAEHDESIASTDGQAQGVFGLRKLDRIELYAKNVSGGTDKLIKTVHFKYDYSLCSGVLNNGNGNGKLTLKKVWFEYNGVVDAKITPYQFEYKYPTSTEANYPARYNDFENYGSYLSAQQNPTYSPFNIDAWGNYQYDGVTRFSDMQPWLDQSGTHTASFDPAAWQLKVIKLPSGGEIHVQYEQDDYCYVQDKAAQAMVSLTGGNHNSGNFTINLADLSNTPLSLAEKQKLAAIIKKEYIDGDKRMYFKMLYKLIGNSTPHLDDCNVEYITGYANVTSVTVNGGGNIEIQLKNSGGYTLPKEVCKDYVTTQRAGNLAPVGSNCNPSENDAIHGPSATEKVLGFVGKAATWLASLAPGTTCLEINYEYSYLKIPLLEAKKGGGVRVKRLLMFDKGIDAGVPVLYGSEYIYKAYDEQRKEYRSSGVATNEPGGIREENALVGFLPRFKQSFLGKVISGRDKDQSEGPLHEGVLPGPSVGYSRIITKSIHSGKTNPGFAIKEFYTAKDYPVKMEMTEMDRSHKDYLPIITGLVNKITNNLWVSQGYSFEINSMHGQLKSSATYAGDYSDILNPNTSLLVSQEVLTYFQPGEELPILDPSDLTYSTTMPLGKEMDMAMESKVVEDMNTDGNLEFDANAGIFGIAVFPFLSAFPSMTFTETKLHTHTTTKIVSYPAIVKSTTSYADGIYHISENVAFNPENGQPIMTRTTDGFANLNLLASNNHNGTYTNYKFPGSLEYENISQKAKNERKIVTGTTGNITITKIIENGKAYLSFAATLPNTVCDAMANFVGGDLIKLSGDGLYHTGAVVGSKIEIQPTNYTSLGSGGSTVNIEIIRSGRTNQLNVNVGSVTTYGQSTVNVTPIDSALLYDRNAFATLLTTSLTTGDTIFSDDIPAGIEFLNADGTCTPLDTSHFILVSGNTVNIYGPGVPYAYDTTIVGTPSTPHPMVDSLNSYISQYWDYALDTSSTDTLKCSFGDTLLYNLLNTSTSVAAMRVLQDTFLSKVFNSVNGGTHAINDVLVDDGVDLGHTKAFPVLDTASNPISMINKRVVLEEITSGKTMGITWQCIPNVSGTDIPTYFSACNDGQGGTLYSNDTTVVGVFKEDASGYLYFLPYEGAEPCLTDIRFYDLEPHSFPELLCSSFLELSEGYGSFQIDPKTAALVYFAADNPCHAQDVPCIRFCSDKYPSTAITGVVASEASTLGDYWDYNPNDYPVNGALVDNDYEMGKKGKWRTERTFAFKTEVDRLSTGHEKNYNSGVYELELFNWEIVNANSQKWLELNKVTKYSPNGNALEEVNILGIKSTAKFGYHKTLPYLIAQNADYKSVMFESFENTYNGGNTLEDGIQINALDGSIDNSVSHSGEQSFKLTFPANDGVEMTEMEVTGQFLSKGMLMKVWIKTDFNDRVLLDNFLKAELLNVNTNQSVSQSFTKIAQVGEWYLYEAKIQPSSFSGMSAGEVLKTFVKYEFSAHGSENVWIDDVRIQPMDAQVTTYVYDVVSHRVITTFDDQHFGLFYQYNAEGKLVRKLIETERGMKTVQETQYNTPKISR